MRLNPLMKSNNIYRRLATGKSIAELELKLTNKTGMLFFVDVRGSFLTNELVLMSFFKKHVYGSARKGKHQDGNPGKGQYVFECSQKAGQIYKNPNKPTAAPITQAYTKKAGFRPALFNM